MRLRGHYQNAYVTHDLQKAMDMLSSRFGLKDFITFDPEMIVKTQAGDQPQRVAVAAAWAGGLQYELIQPVSGFLEPFLEYLPRDESDATPRLHHVSLRRESTAEIEAEIAAMDLPLVCQGGIPDLQFTYLDARPYLGHYLEYVWASEAGWNMVGWPKGLVV